MRTLITSTLALLFTSALLAQAPLKGDRYLVELKPGAKAPDVTALGGVLSGSTAGTLYVILPPEAAAALEHDPAVAAVLPAANSEAGARKSLQMKLDALRVTPNVAPPTWSSGGYVYDGAGNITQIGTQSVPNGDGKTSSFAYDEASRLVSATIGRTDGDRTETYSYDAFGNMKDRWVNQQERNFGGADPATNQLNQGTYENVGNMTNDGAAGQYTYDALNMLTTKSVTSGGIETYIYTPSDERIGAKQPNGYWSWTLRDFDGKPMRQFKSDASVTTNPTTWTWVEDYVWQGGRLIGAENAVGRRHFHLDHLGSPRLITNQSGGAISLHDYAPYGEEITPDVQESSTYGREEPLKFTGHERDSAWWVSGQNEAYVDYMHARYYGPTVGRFLSMDPPPGNPRVAQSWNRYTYVLNNPANLVDPFGLYTCKGNTPDQCRAFDTAMLILKAAMFESARKDRPAQRAYARS